MKAFVTGATGCVGANTVAALLERGHTVRAAQRPTSRMDALEGLEVELVVADILDPDSLLPAMAGCDWVLHIAAVSDYWRTPAATIYHVNVEGTRNVVQAALRAGVQRLVLTSSVAALGLPQGRSLLDESATFNLPPERFPYGHSKHLAEGVVREAIAQGLDAVIVNPGAVIGPRDVHWISGSLLKEVQEGWGWFAPPGGVSWAAATDVGVGHVLAAEKGRTGERYILAGENCSHRQAIELVAQIVGGRRPVMTVPRPLMILLAWLVRGAGRSGRLPFSADQAWLSAHHIYCDNSKAVRELGYPQTPLRTAIEQAYNWYRERGWLRQAASRPQ